MGELGVELSDPDSPSLDVLNEILNSFGGVLFNEIRSKEVGHVNHLHLVGGGCLVQSLRHLSLLVIPLVSCSLACASPQTLSRLVL